jgi:hypothetical protein
LKPIRIDVSTTWTKDVVERYRDEFFQRLLRASVTCHVGVLTFDHNTATDVTNFFFDKLTNPLSWMKVNRVVGVWTDSRLEDSSSENEASQLIQLHSHAEQASARSNTPQVFRDIYRQIATETEVQLHTLRREKRVSEEYLVLSRMLARVSIMGSFGRLLQALRNDESGVRAYCAAQGATTGKGRDYSSVAKAIIRKDLAMTHKALSYWFQIGAALTAAVSVLSYGVLAALDWQAAKRYVLPPHMLLALSINSDLVYSGGAPPG